MEDTSTNELSNVHHPEKSDQSTTNDAQITQPFKLTEHIQLNYTSQFALLIGLVGVGLLLGGMVSAVVVIANTKGSLTTLTRGSLEAVHPNVLKAVQVISTFFAFLVPALVFCFINRQKPSKRLGFNLQFNIQQLAIVAGLAFVGLFLSGALAEINHIIPIPHTWEMKFKVLEEEYNKQVLVIANVKNVVDYLIALVVIAIMPAIFEEILFRGALQRLFADWFKNVHVAILVTSILFSLIHFSYYGFLPRMVLGIVLGYVFYFGKSIWLPIWLHFINNGVAVTQLYYLSMHKQLKPETLDDSYPIWYLIPTATIMFFLFKIFYAESIKLQKNLI